MISLRAGMKRIQRAAEPGRFLPVPGCPGQAPRGIEERAILAPPLSVTLLSVKP